MTTSDLVDYLRDKLKACTCAGYMVGRPAIGMFRIMDWTPSCPQHVENPWGEHNQEQFRLIDEGNIAEQARLHRWRKPWWRR